MSAVVESVAALSRSAHQSGAGAGNHHSPRSPTTTFALDRSALAHPPLNPLHPHGTMRIVPHSGTAVAVPDATVVRQTIYTVPPLPRLSTAVSHDDSTGGSDDADALATFVVTHGGDPTARRVSLSTPASRRPLGADSPANTISNDGEEDEEKQDVAVVSSETSSASGTKRTHGNGGDDDGQGGSASSSSGKKPRR